MSQITNSGLYGDDLGQVVLVTQGLIGYTLVAHKKILFRLFLLDLSPNTFIAAVVVEIKVKLSSGIEVNEGFVIPSDSLIIEHNSPNGPSVGILLSGDVFPFVASYEITFDVYGNLPSAPHFEIKELVFSLPGRVRLLIHNLVGTAGWGTKIEPNIGWLLEMLDALERLATMLPVHDGVRLGLTRRDAGVCFAFGENVDPFACPSGPCTKAEKIAKMVREAREINSRGTAEHVDATICWRPRDYTKLPPPGEDAGGVAFPSEELVSMVGGNENGVEKTASVMAQEVGHVFGLEPPESPHFNGGGHSKDEAVFDPFAFDFYHLKPYQPHEPPPTRDFIGDVMGLGWHQGRDMVLYNAFDWEFLRKKLVQLPGIYAPLAAKKRSTKEQQNELFNDFRKSLTGEPKIKIANIGKALPTKEGFVWHWTSHGFQLIRRAKYTKTRSGLGPSVEGIRSWLEDLGISEVYAPIGDWPLRMVINPNARISLPESEFHDFDLSEHRLTGE
jgi:hypothetical protein